MPQLMAGRVVQPGPAPRPGQDLIHPRSGQRLPAARPLQHHEDPVGAGTGRPLIVQVGGHRSEEPARHRDQPLPAGLALGDEHPPLGHPQVLQPQPEDLAAAQPAQHHRRDHRPVPLRAQRPHQRIHLGRRQDLRQPPSRADQRDTLARTRPLPPGRQPPRHRVRHHIPAGLQEREEPRHDRQAPAHRGGRHAAVPARHSHRMQRPAPAAASALRSDEPQDIGGLNLIRRPGHHLEEHLQVIRGRQHRVRPAPPAQELQVDIDQRNPDPDHQAATPVTRADHARIGSIHQQGLPSSQQTNPSRVVQMTTKITYITCM